MAQVAVKSLAPDDPMFGLPVVIVAAPLPGALHTLPSTPALLATAPIAMV